jgi:peptidyl-dipeptidase Dcp
MAWHTLDKPLDKDVVSFEQEAWKKAVILPQPDSCFMSATFGHLFSGGYAAGYYSYKWAEVLDADAFEWLTRRKVFDQDAAASFRKEILSRGGTEPPMVLYVRFRGQEPSIQPLLRRDGIE